MNNITLIGRLTADPILSATNNGKYYTRSTLAVNRQGGNDEVDFIDFVAWNKTAEIIAQYFTKGQRIGIVGSLRISTFTDKQGANRKKAEVWVNSIDFIEKKTATPQSQNGIAGFVEVSPEELAEEDIPF